MAGNFSPSKDCNKNVLISFDHVGFKNIFQAFKGFFKISKDFSRLQKIFLDLKRFEKIFQDRKRFFKVFLVFKILSKISKEIYSIQMAKYCKRFQNEILFHSVKSLQT